MNLINFNWFIHVMIFYHTRDVLAKLHSKQQAARTSTAMDIDEDQNEDEEDIGVNEDELVDLDELNF